MRGDKEGVMSTSSPPLPHRSRAVPFFLGFVTALVVVLLVAPLVVVSIREDVGAPNEAVGSGIASSQARPLARFTSLELAGSNVVSVHVGSPQRITVHADDNLIGRVTTVVHDSRLSIGIRGSFETTAPMHVDVRVPELTSVTLSGSGTIAIDGIRAETFTVDVAGSGTIDLSGTTSHLAAAIHGSGMIHARSLSARHVTARIPGTGSIQVTATKAIDAAIAGTGSITYAGDPAHVTGSVTGVGTIGAA
jgi:Putative auto-transporter adhesin, head GIN domain